MVVRRRWCGGAFLVLVTAIVSAPRGVQSLASEEGSRGGEAGGEIGGGAQACTYSVNPPLVNVGAEGGSGSFTVTAPIGCAWTPNSNAVWLTPGNTSTQQGSGTVTWSATPNIATGGSREGGILIGNVYFNAFQCEQVVTPRTIALSAGAGSTTVHVVSSGSCPWTASAPAGSFATITGGAHGVGQGPVTIAYTANPTIQPRSTVVTVAGQPVTLTQPGATCTYSLNPSSINVGAEGGSGSFTVTAPGGCAWTPNSNAVWLTPGNTSTQQGSGTVSWTATPNIDTGGSRTGGILIGGVYFNAFQCEQVVSPRSITVAAGAGSTAVSVISSGSCPWTATAPAGSFATIAGGATGIGQGPVTIAYTAAKTTQTRMTTLTVAGTPVTVTQPGAACTYALTPSSIRIGAAGGSGSVDVSPFPDDCSWAPNSGAAWLQPTNTTTRLGDGRVDWVAEPNLSGAPRETVLLIGDASTAAWGYLTATQCHVGLSASSLAVPAGAGTATVQVTAPEDCDWTATAAAGSFAQVTGTGVGRGSGTLSIAYGPAPTTQARVTTVTVGGSPVTISQAGAVCAYSFSPPWARIEEEGGTGTFDVWASASDCVWAPISGAAWLALDNAAPRQGNGSVTWTAAPSTSADARDAVILVGNDSGGQYFQLTQSTGGTVDCSYAVSPSLVRVGPENQSITVSVGSQAGCPWIAETGSPFMHVTDGATGSGWGTAGIRLDNNTNDRPRVDSLVIAGQVVTVVQAAANGVSCEYAVHPGDLDFQAAGGSATLSIAPNYAECPWTVVSDATWLRVTSGYAGAGAGITTIEAEGNPTDQVRNATLSIGGTEVYVEVAYEASSSDPGGSESSACPVSLSTRQFVFDWTGGTLLVDITADSSCKWTVTDLPAWVALDRLSGTGSGVLSLTAPPNSAADPRGGLFTINGVESSVLQSGTDGVAQPSDGTASTVDAQFEDIQGVATCTWSINSGSRHAWVHRAITVFDHNNRRLGSDSFFGFAFTLRVEEKIPVANYPRTWRCVGFDPRSGRIIDQRTLTIVPQQASGSGIMRLTLNAFLPYDHIPDPHPILGSDRVFEGDGFGRTFDENGSSRTTQIVELIDPRRYPLSGSILSGPHEYTALTQQYEGSTSIENGRLTLRARNDWNPGAPLKTAWGTAENRGAGCIVSRFGHVLAVECEVETPNGVYNDWLEPRIVSRLTLGFDFEGSPSVRWSMSGCHKRFPAYEVWAAGQPILAAKDSGNTWDLLTPCERSVPVEESGVIIVP